MNAANGLNQSVISNCTSNIDIKSACARVTPRSINRPPCTTPSATTLPGFTISRAPPLLANILGACPHRRRRRRRHSLNHESYDNSRIIPRCAISCGGNVVRRRNSPGGTIAQIVFLSFTGPLTVNARTILQSPFPHSFQPAKTPKRSSRETRSRANALRAIVIPEKTSRPQRFRQSSANKFHDCLYSTQPLRGATAIMQMGLELWIACQYIAKQLLNLPPRRERSPRLTFDNFV